MTTHQRIMLFKLFSQAMAIRRIFGVTARDLERERITIDTFGAPRSWSTFNNRDVDRIKAALLAIVKPADLHAQVRQIAMPRTRLLYGLRKHADQAYIARIALDRFSTNDYRTLPDHDLEKLHMTVCNRSRHRKSSTCEKSQTEPPMLEPALQPASQPQQTECPF